MAAKFRIARLMLPDFLRDRCPDGEHPHRRRFTAAYRRKRGLVKNVWMVSGLVMALQGSLAVVLVMTLGTTFLSFVILDETD
jgi:hypothetical protein